ncbi:MAG: heme lyase CcmF/NrfE family subunit [Gaiella sp.]
MPELGRAALILTLGLSLYGLAAGGYAAWAGRRRLANSARNAVLASFASTLVATAVLVGSFVTNDFSNEYVATHSSRDLPFGYKISALWGGQEGSLILWLLVLNGLSAAALVASRLRASDITRWVVPVLAGVSTGFAWILVGVTSPFTTIPAPLDGSGLTPSLQNPYMATHPPLLYVGYVGLAIPWAFAMGSLLSGRTDERWLVLTRRWTLVAWAALGIGQLLGAHWAYEEVGWGGYYAWDPVENAALMPWLAATAFLHSVMIQEKRGMLRVWNVVLVSLAFCLSVFGTFLTRSGVISSIHSFSAGPLGAWFLALVVIAIAVSVALIVHRLPQLRSQTRLESLLSREATFLYNNLLLVALCLTILWGVAWPLVSEAVRGEAVVVGRPYYDFFLRIFGLPLLLLMGIAPLIAWRRASLRGLGRLFVWPAVTALAAGVLLVALGAGSSIPGLIAYTFSAFVTATIVLEFVRGTRARRALSGGSVPAAFAQLVARNRRRYGGYVVHFAIVLLAVGIAGSSAYDTEAENTSMRPGETLAVGDYRLTLEGTAEREAPNAIETRAVFAVARDGSDLGPLEAGENAYAVEGEISNEVGIRTDLARAEDLFVIAELRQNGTVNARAFVKPLVNLIWLAGLVFLLGSLITLWPDAREERRLVTRFEEARRGVASRAR